MDEKTTKMVFHWTEIASSTSVLENREQNELFSLRDLKNSRDGTFQGSFAP